MALLTTGNRTENTCSPALLQVKSTIAMLLEKQLGPLVDAIKSKKRKVTFFCGAGISTACGIPDFRSPKTGLYANLQRLNLPYAEAVFDIDYFKKDPKAFYTLCQELYPGKFVPSKFHFLMKLFQDKGLLHRVYTQNIDTLERIAGVHGDFIVEAHGSFAENHCINCKEPMSTDELKKHMNSDVNDGIPTCASCKGYIKPDIVFFGEGLPERFFELWEEDADVVDVAVVAGTSLTVFPFALLPAECGKNALRVLINKEVVGDFKARKRKSDIILQYDCDHIATVLADLLGWSEELAALVDLATKETIPVEEKSDEAESTRVSSHEGSESSSDSSNESFKDAILFPAEAQSTDSTDDLDAQMGKLGLE